MKKSKFLLTTMFSTTMLISGLGLGFGKSAHAEEFPQLTNEKVQTEIQEMKDAGMTSEEVQKFYEMSKEEYAYVQEHAEDLYKDSQKEIKELKASGQIDEVLPKYKEPEYQPKNQIAAKALGTKGDVLTSYEINSGSWSIGVGHAAVVSTNKSKTVEAWAKSWSPINQDGVRRYNNNWGSKKESLWSMG